MQSRPKKLSSLSEHQITAAFDSARCIASIPGLRLLAAPLPTELALYGRLLIVTRRTVAKAHDRNRMRRRVKAIFYGQKLYEKKRIFILLVYKEALALSFEALERFLVQAIEKIKA